MSQKILTAEAAYERRKSAIGIRMTLIYSLVYAGFVGLSVFQPTWMGVRALLGLNLAVTYGLGLILVAILFAIVYNQLCRVPASDSTPGAQSGSSADSKE